MKIVEVVESMESATGYSCIRLSLPHAVNFNVNVADNHSGYGEFITQNAVFCITPGSRYLPPTVTFWACIGLCALVRTL